jgi:hypothetical protein
MFDGVIGVNWEVTAGLHVFTSNIVTIDRFRRAHIAFLLTAFRSICDVDREIGMVCGNQKSLQMKPLLFQSNCYVTH